MPEKLPKITSCFTITADSDFDPHIISRRVPINPTSVIVKGEPNRRPDLPHKWSSWTFECKNREIQSIQDGICEVLDIVWPHRAKIIQVLDDMKLSSHFMSHVRIYELGVVYDFSTETMKRMAELKAEWSMDLYDFSNTEPQPAGK